MVRVKISSGFQKDIDTILIILLGGVIGYLFGAMHSTIFVFILIKSGELIFNEFNFLSALLNFLLLKDDFTIFPQIISTIFGTLIGYYYIKKTKIAFILSVLLFCFFIIYIIFWYIFLKYIF